MQERKQPLRFRLRSTTSPYTGEALLVHPSSNSSNSVLWLCITKSSHIHPQLQFNKLEFSTTIHSSLLSFISNKKSTLSGCFFIGYLLHI